VLEFAGSTIPAVTMFVLLAEGDCVIITDTEEFDELNAASNQIPVSVHGVFSASAGTRMYHLCWLASAGADSSRIHLTAVTEALNGRGGTSAPIRRGRNRAGHGRVAAREVAAATG
jgi:hypothetical protein